MKDMKDLETKTAAFFEEEVNTQLCDVFRASYYAVKAHLGNPNVILPCRMGRLIRLGEVNNSIVIDWLADTDDYGACISHYVATKYAFPSPDNGFRSTIEIQELIPRPLDRERFLEKDVKARWELLNRIIPESKRAPEFNICLWYSIVW